MSIARLLSGLKTLPPRPIAFVGRPGPIAWLGLDDRRTGAPQILRTAMKVHANRTPTDFYSDIEWLDEGSVVDAPPLSVPVLPVLDCGVLSPDEGTSANEIYLGIKQASAALAEKGYVPMCVGGTLQSALPVVEGLKSIVPDDIVLVHFGADTGMGAFDAPLKVLLEKQLLKGVAQFGTRGVNATARSTRKDHMVRYIDALGVHAKGSFTVKDIRNDYPVFLSIDASVLDPAFAPGVVNPEPAGLSTRDVCHLISVLRGTRVMGVSLTGFAPQFDVARGTNNGPEHSLTALALSKVAKEAILKVYAIHTMTAAEGMAHVQELRKQGQHPAGQYPDF